MASVESKRARRLNQRAGNTGTITSEDIHAITAIWGEECFYCLTPLAWGPEGNGSFDHLVSTMMGGRNTRRNLVPCCDSCNNRKGSKMVYWDSDRKLLVFRYTPPLKRKW